MNNNKRNESHHIIIVGDAGVGKTVFVQRNFSGDFHHEYKLGFGFDVTPLYQPEKQIVLNVWVQVGDQKFVGSNYKPYYELAEAAIIMFDVTSRESYDNLEYWYDKVSKLCPPNIPIVLCGTKCDVKERKVHPKDILFHKEKGLKYFDISSKSNYNVTKPIDYIVDKICGGL